MNHVMIGEDIYKQVIHPGHLGRPFPHPPTKDLTLRWHSIPTTLCCWGRILLLNLNIWASIWDKSPIPHPMPQEDLPTISLARPNQRRTSSSNVPSIMRSKCSFIASIETREAPSPRFTIPTIDAKLLSRWRC